MTDDNSNPSKEELVDMDDLDAFEKDFFNTRPGKAPMVEEKKPEPKEAPADEAEEEEDPEIEDDALATEEDTDASEDNPEDEDPEDEEAEEPKPEKKGKKSFQDRINELTAKAREAERREAELIRRLEQIEKAREPEENAKPEPKPLREQLPAEAPSPDAVDENGEAVYPLGEFDPKYIRDLTKFTIAEETKAAKAAEEQARQQSLVEAAQEELKSSWLEKVEKAQEELPDLREKLAEMGETFADVDPDYGEFLAATIMSCDYGPQIMYYLSQNIDEAQKIVASGPASATLSIGPLDARFTKAPAEEEKRNTKKVSEAPKPPAAMSRGSGGRYKVSGDTDDLDAFEKEFFKRK